MKRVFTNKRSIGNALMDLSKDTGMVQAAENANLLIADDDRAFRETVIELLQPHFPAIAVESGERAIEIVGEIEVDLVILDMHMHLMTGLDTLRWLKEHDINLPCILMSSEVSDELEAMAYDLEAFSVLRKPPRRKHLIEIIECALKL